MEKQIDIKKQEGLRPTFDITIDEAFVDEVYKEREEYNDDDFVEIENEMKDGRKDFLEEREEDERQRYEDKRDRDENIGYREYNKLDYVNEKLNTKKEHFVNSLFNQKGISESGKVFDESTDTYVNYIRVQKFEKERYLSLDPKIVHSINIRNEICKPYFKYFKVDLNNAPKLIEIEALEAISFVKNDIPIFDVFGHQIRKVQMSNNDQYPFDVNIYFSFLGRTSDHLKKIGLVLSAYRFDDEQKNVILASAANVIIDNKKEMWISELLTQPQSITDEVNDYVVPPDEDLKDNLMIIPLSKRNDNYDYIKKTINDMYINDKTNFGISTKNTKNEDYHRNYSDLKPETIDTFNAALYVIIKKDDFISNELINKIKYDELSKKYPANQLNEEIEKTTNMMGVTVTLSSMFVWEQGYKGLDPRQSKFFELVSKHVKFDAETDMATDFSYKFFSAWQTTHHLTKHYYVDPSMASKVNIQLLDLVMTKNGPRFMPNVVSFKELSKEINAKNRVGQWDYNMIASLELFCPLENQATLKYSIGNGNMYTYYERFYKIKKVREQVSAMIFSRKHFNSIKKFYIEGEYITNYPIDLINTIVNQYEGTYYNALFKSNIMSSSRDIYFFNVCDNGKDFYYMMPENLSVFFRYINNKVNMRVSIPDDFVNNVDYTFRTPDYNQIMPFTPNFEARNMSLSRIYREDTYTSELTRAMEMKKTFDKCYADKLSVMKNTKLEDMSEGEILKQFFVNNKKELYECIDKFKELYEVDFKHVFVSRKFEINNKNKATRLFHISNGSVSVIPNFFVNSFMARLVELRKDIPFSMYGASTEGTDMSDLIFSLISGSLTIAQFSDNIYLCDGNYYYSMDISSMEANHTINTMLTSMIVIGLTICKTLYDFNLFFFIVFFDIYINPVKEGFFKIGPVVNRYPLTYMISGKYGTTAFNDMLTKYFVYILHKEKITCIQNGEVSSSFLAKTEQFGLKIREEVKLDINNLVIGKYYNFDMLGYGGIIINNSKNVVSALDKDRLIKAILGDKKEIKGEKNKTKDFPLYPQYIREAMNYMKVCQLYNTGVPLYKDLHQAIIHYIVKMRETLSVRVFEDFFNYNKVFVQEQLDIYGLIAFLEDPKLMSGEEYMRKHCNNVLVDFSSNILDDIDNDTKAKLNLKPITIEGSREYIYIEDIKDDDKVIKEDTKFKIVDLPPDLAKKTTFSDCIFPIIKKKIKRRPIKSVFKFLVEFLFAPIAVYYGTLDNYALRDLETVFKVNYGRLLNRIQKNDMSKDNQQLLTKMLRSKKELVKHRGVKIDYTMQEYHVDFIFQFDLKATKYTNDEYLLNSELLLMLDEIGVVYDNCVKAQQEMKLTIVNINQEIIAELNKPIYYLEMLYESNKYLWSYDKYVIKKDFFFHKVKKITSFIYDSKLDSIGANHNLFSKLHRMSLEASKNHDGGENAPYLVFGGLINKQQQVEEWSRKMNINKFVNSVYQYQIIEYVSIRNSTLLERMKKSRNAFAKDIAWFITYVVIVERNKDLINSLFTLLDAITITDEFRALLPKDHKRFEDGWIIAYNQLVNFFDDLPENLKGMFTTSVSFQNYNMYSTLLNDFKFYEGFVKVEVGDKIERESYPDTDSLVKKLQPYVNDKIIKKNKRETKMIDVTKDIININSEIKPKSRIKKNDAFFKMFKTVREIVSEDVQETPRTTINNAELGKKQAMIKFPPKIENYTMDFPNFSMVVENGLLLKWTSNWHLNSFDRCDLKLACETLGVDFNVIVAEKDPQKVYDAGNPMCFRICSGGVARAMSFAYYYFFKNDKYNLNTFNRKLILNKSLDTLYCYDELNGTLLPVAQDERFSMFKDVLPTNNKKTHIIKFREFLKVVDDFDSNIEVFRLFLQPNSIKYTPKQVQVYHYNGTMSQIGVCVYDPIEEVVRIFREEKILKREKKRGEIRILSEDYTCDLRSNLDFFSHHVDHIIDYVLMNFGESAFYSMQSYFRDPPDSNILGCNVELSDFSLLNFKR